MQVGKHRHGTIGAERCESLESGKCNSGVATARCIIVSLFRCDDRSHVLKVAVQRVVTDDPLNCNSSAQMNSFIFANNNRMHQ